MKTTHLISTFLFLFTQLVVLGQQEGEVITTIATEEGSKKVSKELIDELLYVPDSMICDTQKVLTNKKTFIKCLYNNNSSLQIHHMGREYIEGEGPKLLHKETKYVLEKGVPKYATEYEYFYDKDKTTKKKKTRGWKGYYKIDGESANLFDETYNEKERRSDFDQSDVIKFYNKAIKQLEDTKN